MARAKEGCQTCIHKNICLESFGICNNRNCEDYINKDNIVQKIKSAEKNKRYIDADLFVKESKYYVTEKDIEFFIQKHGYADVVPKSELEQLKEANAGLSLALLYECEPTRELLSELEKAVREKVVRDIFEEIEKHQDKIHRIVLLLPEELSELEKEIREKCNEGIAKNGNSSLITDTLRKL